MTLKDFFPKPSADNDGDRKKPNKIIIFVIIFKKNFILKIYKIRYKI